MARNLLRARAGRHPSWTAAEGCWYKVGSQAGRLAGTIGGKIVPLFRRQHGISMHDVGVPVPGLEAMAAAQGWQPVTGDPFDGHFGDVVHETTCTMYGFPPGMDTWQRKAVKIADTVYRDAYHLAVDGRKVMVANAWTNIQPESRYVDDDMKGVAVCAAELPTFLTLACVQPRRFKPMMPLHDTPTGNADFDARFITFAALGAEQQVLIPDVQRLVMARDDWAFRAERYLFGCISLGPFQSADDVTRRIADVLAIVAALPTSVVPDHIDHAADDLVARAAKLTSLDQALAFLQGLTPDERDRLAASDSPLAVMADVRTPEEAMARFQTLDEQKKMELFAMVMRVKDDQRGK
jgi:hypothetical protein